MKDYWETPQPNRGNKMYKFQQKLKFIKDEIKTWNTQTFGNIIMEKKLLELKQEALQQQIINNGLTEQRKVEKIML